MTTTIQKSNDDDMVPIEPSSSDHQIYDHNHDDNPTIYSLDDSDSDNLSTEGMPPRPDSGLFLDDDAAKIAVALRDVVSSNDDSEESSSSDGGEANASDCDSCKSGNGTAGNAFTAKQQEKKEEEQGSLDQSESVTENVTTRGPLENVEKTKTNVTNKNKTINNNTNTKPSSATTTTTTPSDVFSLNNCIGIIWELVFDLPLVLSQLVLQAAQPHRYTGADSYLKSTSPSPSSSSSFLLSSAVSFIFHWSGVLAFVTRAGLEFYEVFIYIFDEEGWSHFLRRGVAQLEKVANNSHIRIRFWGIGSASTTSSSSTIFNFFARYTSTSTSQDKKQNQDQDQDELDDTHTASTLFFGSTRNQLILPSGYSHGIYSAILLQQYHFTNINMPAFPQFVFKPMNILQRRNSLTKVVHRKSLDVMPETVLLGEIGVRRSSSDDVIIGGLCKSSLSLSDTLAASSLSASEASNSCRRDMMEFVDLPTAVMIKVLGYLTPVGLIRCEQTCRDMCSLVKELEEELDDSVWKSWVRSQIDLDCDMPTCLLQGERYKDVVRIYRGWETRLVSLYQQATASLPEPVAVQSVNSMPRLAGGFGVRRKVTAALGVDVVVVDGQLFYLSYSPLRLRRVDLEADLALAPGHGNIGNGGGDGITGLPSPSTSSSSMMENSSAMLSEALCTFSESLGMISSVVRSDAIPVNSWSPWRDGGERFTFLSATATEASGVKWGGEVASNSCGSSVLSTESGRSGDSGDGKVIGELGCVDFGDLSYFRDSYGTVCGDIFVVCHNTDDTIMNGRYLRPGHEGVVSLLPAAPSSEHQSNKSRWMAKSRSISSTSLRRSGSISSLRSSISTDSLSDDETLSNVDDTSTESSTTAFSGLAAAMCASPTCTTPTSVAVSGDTQFAPGPSGIKDTPAQLRPPLVEAYRISKMTSSGHGVVKPPQRLWSVAQTDFPEPFATALYPTCNEYLVAHTEHFAPRAAAAFMRDRILHARSADEVTQVRVRRIVGSGSTRGQKSALSGVVSGGNGGDLWGDKPFIDVRVRGLVIKNLCMTRHHLVIVSLRGQACHVAQDAENVASQTQGGPLKRPVVVSVYQLKGMKFVGEVCLRQLVALGTDAKVGVKCSDNGARLFVWTEEASSVVRRGGVSGPEFGKDAGLLQNHAIRPTMACFDFLAG
ncbi:hypothetical protein HDU76_005811, partial [Blyttiomyces sp. JEL0837]